MTTQQEIINKYGQPGPVYQSKYCTLWQIDHEFHWFPAKRIFINTDFKAKLTVALQGIGEADLQGEIKTFDGCYMERTVRGSTKISLHSWAMAIDINSHEEKLGQEKSHFSKQFIDIMINAGLYWGGNFQKRKDNMHFSLYNG